MKLVVVLLSFVALYCWDVQAGELHPQKWWDLVQQGKKRSVDDQNWWDSVSTVGKRSPGNSRELQCCDLVKRSVENAVERRSRDIDWDDIFDEDFFDFDDDHDYDHDDFEIMKYIAPSLTREMRVRQMDRVISRLDAIRSSLLARKQMLINKQQEQPAVPSP